MDVQFTPTEETPKARQEPTPKKQRGRPAGTTNAAKLETELRQDLTMMLKLGSMAWTAQDPVCGPVLNEQAELIAADIAKFVARQSWAKKWLDNSFRMSEVIQFLMHVQPVIAVIAAHHMSPTQTQPASPGDSASDYPTTSE